MMAYSSRLLCCVAWLPLFCAGFLLEVRSAPTRLLGVRPVDGWDDIEAAQEVAKKVKLPVVVLYGEDDGNFARLARTFSGDFVVAPFLGTQKRFVQVFFGDESEIFEDFNEAEEIFTNMGIPRKNKKPIVLPPRGPPPPVRRTGPAARKAPPAAAREKVRTTRDLFPDPEKWGDPFKGWGNQEKKKKQPDRRRQARQPSFGEQIDKLKREADAFSKNLSRDAENFGDKLSDSLAASADDLSAKVMGTETKRDRLNRLFSAEEPPSDLGEEKDLLRAEEAGEFDLDTPPEDKKEGDDDKKKKN